MVADRTGEWKNIDMKYRVINNEILFNASLTLMP